MTRWVWLSLRASGGCQSPASLGGGGSSPGRVQEIADKSLPRGGGLGGKLPSVTALGRALSLSKSDLPSTVRRAVAFLENAVYIKTL